MADYAQMSVPKSYRDQARRLREEIVRRKAAGEPLPAELERFLSGEGCPYCTGTSITLPQGMERFATCRTCGGQWHVAREGQTDLDGFLKTVGMVTLVGLGLYLLGDILRTRRQ